MNSQNEKHKVWLYNLAWYDGREIGKVCLDWGVILHGLEINGWAKSTSKRFREEMQENNIVVMRWWIDGKRKEHRVGQVVGNHEWHDEFRNIDGWDLSRVRRVRWLSKKVMPNLLEEFSSIKTISANGILKCINGYIDHTELINKLDQIGQDKWVESSKNLSEPKVEFEEVSKDKDEYLKSVYKCEDISTFIDKASKFIPDTSVEGNSNSKLKYQLQEMTELLKWHELNWYDNDKAYLSEHETVCHFVVPLLMALGWNQKQIAVEWGIPGIDKRIDIALFQNQDDNPCQRKSLLAIVEVKQLGKALLPAYSQAREYWKEIDKLPKEEIDKSPKCKRIILTDGRRYMVYKNTEGNFDDRGDKIYAYMDLARPRDEYPAYYECAKGFKEALLAMLPNGCP